MVNQKHINWLKAGIEDWNARRVREPFLPDFSGGFASGASDLRDMQLYGANMSGGDFSGGLFVGVNFAGADLTDSDFSRSILCNANFDGAKLDRARFTDAYLTAVGPRLMQRVRRQLGSLAPASLSDASVKEADFSEAYLADVILGGTKLWDANLFPDNDILLEPNLESNEVYSMQDFMQITGDIAEWYSAKNGLDDVVLYFRGEPRLSDQSGDWKLQPSVKREGFAPFESQMLVDFMAKHPHEFTGLSSALSKWVFAQHHLLKTRFLDVTTNPLVGLFFACEKDPTECGRIHVFVVPRSMIKSHTSDSVSIVANFARLPRSDQDIILGKIPDSAALVGDDYGAVMGRLYQAIREEKPSFERRIDPRDFYRIFVIEPQYAFERIRAQSGAIMSSAFHERFENVEVSAVKNANTYAHYTVLVPSNCKGSMLAELRRFNVVRESLFPGLDESALAIGARYR